MNKESYGKPSDLITPKEFIDLFYGEQVYIERSKIDNRIVSVLDPFFDRIEEPSCIMEELGRIKILIEGIQSSKDQREAGESGAIETIISLAMSQEEPVKLLRRIAEIMDVMLTPKKKGGE